MAGRGFITAGTQEFPHRLPSQIPKPLTWQWALGGIQTPQQSQYIHSQHNLFPNSATCSNIYFFLIPAPVPQPNACSRQLCHLASIKPGGAWDRTGFSSQPCPRAASVELTAASLYFIPFLHRKKPKTNHKNKQKKKKINSLLESNIRDQSPSVASLGAKYLISFRQCWKTAVSFRVVRRKQAGEDRLQAAPQLYFTSSLEQKTPSKKHDLGQGCSLQLTVF